jgi:alcohol dehydrogenase (NADP+)
MVGAAIKKSGIPRSELFITTKLWNNSHSPKDVEPALDASLQDLGMEYVDLFLFHWPGAFKSGDSKFPKDQDGKIETENIPYLDTWKAMEKLVKTGKTKAIGISNFSKAEVETLLKEGSIVPVAHQIECHPWLQQNEFTEWLKAKGIHVQQYSPFGNQMRSTTVERIWASLWLVISMYRLGVFNSKSVFDTNDVASRMNPFSPKSARNTTRPAHR